MWPVIGTLSLGPLALRVGGYGLALAVAWCVGSGLWLRRMEREGLDVGACVAALGAATAAAFLGAYALALPLHWITTGRLQGGLVFYGAALAGLLTLAWVLRWGRVPLTPALGLAVLPLAFGQALGRIGCLLGGCCYGRRWEGALALRLEGVARVPWPLLEAGCVLGLAFALERYVARAERFAAYVAGYALLRLSLEWLRGDALRGQDPWLGLSTSQWLSLFILLGVVGYLRRRLARGEPGRQTLPHV